MIGQGLAGCAGICAAMASVCAKLAMAAPTTLGLCKTSRHILVEHAKSNHWEIFASIDSYIPPCGAVVMYMRLSFFGLIFLFNALMWTLFTKALQKCANTVEATVINTASNIFFTAVVGHLAFGETVSLMWLAGASLILIGLAFIHTSSATDETQSADEKKQK